MLVELWERGRALLRQQNQKVLSALPEAAARTAGSEFRRILQRTEGTFCIKKFNNVIFHPGIGKMQRPD